MTDSLPRDASGRPINYVAAAHSPHLAGRYFGYVALPTGGWRCVGLFDTEAAARAAVGLSEKGEC